MPPCPTSSSTSYRPAIFSPTTGRTLPGARAPYAAEAQAQPQASAPDCVEQEDEPGDEPERNGPGLARPLSGERNEPPEGDDSADDHDDACPAEPEGSEDERQRAGNESDEEPGHPGLYRRSAGEC